MMTNKKNGSSGNKGAGVLTSNEINLVLDSSPVFPGLYLDILSITSYVSEKLEDDA